MRAYIKCLSLVLVLVSVLSCVSLYSVGAEGAYIKPEEFIYGDVDMDGVVTVKDATAIQKGLAELEYLTAVQRYLADPNGEGVTVKSATAIQKHIAGLGGGSSIDEVVEMKLDRDFSSAVSEDAEFLNDLIIVMVKEGCEDYIYTLADFPEYEFESVYRLDEDMLFLYMKTPTRECIFEALEALDYRANLDVLDVSPNLLWHMD